MAAFGRQNRDAMAVAGDGGADSHCMGREATIARLPGEPGGGASFICGRDTKQDVRIFPSVGISGWLVPNGWRWTVGFSGENPLVWAA